MIHFENKLKTHAQVYFPRGGNLKKFEQGGSVYFFGSEIWLKFTFLGEKNIIIFLDCKFLKLFFCGHSR